ncbi:MAG: hypothetical protein IIY49_10015 [Eubacterium sp.]|nr:hypothetical protein [Eubacterium sp.]
MGLEDNYKKKSMEMQSVLEKEIQRVRDGSSNRNINQLFFIKNELSKTIDTWDAKLSFQNMINDMWNDGDKLANELLGLADTYEKLQVLLSKQKQANSLKV